MCTKFLHRKRVLLAQQANLYDNFTAVSIIITLMSELSSPLVVLTFFSFLPNHLISGELVLEQVGFQVYFALQP